MREEALWWLKSSCRDVERAKISLQYGDTAAAAFWSQQAAEKALKGLLLWEKGWFPRTHNIRRLVGELETKLPLTQEELEAAFELTQYYSLSRYPDITEGPPEEVISKRTATRAVEIAGKLTRAAAEVMGEEACGN